MHQEFPFTFRRAQLGVTWTKFDGFRSTDGAQHACLGDAVRAECEAHLRAGGLDPAKHRREIEDTIDGVYGP